ncbi:hypothetical protein Tco_0741030 [Tanacetum coccineum]
MKNVVPAPPMDPPNILDRSSVWEIRFEADFPAIIYNDTLTSRHNVSSEPTNSDIKPMDSVICASNDTAPIEFDENLETNHDVKCEASEKSLIGHVKAFEEIHVSWSLKKKRIRFTDNPKTLEVLLLTELLGDGCEIDRAAGSKLRNKNADESWEIIENSLSTYHEGLSPQHQALGTTLRLRPIKKAEEEEVVEVLSSRPVEYYLKHRINEKLIEGLVDNNRFNNSVSRGSVGGKGKDI